MQFSKKQKLFCQFFSAFLKSMSNFADADYERGG